MIGNTRFRRLATVGVAAALAVTAAGCTLGTSIIPRGVSNGIVVCPIKAGQTSAARYWQPGPGTVRLRFEILKSDAAYGLTVWPGADGGPMFAEGNIEMVWDGTKSTGPKEVEWGTRKFSALLLIPVAGVNPWPAPPRETHTTWALTALDANGNDVGFTCAYGWVTPADA